MSCPPRNMVKIRSAELNRLRRIEEEYNSLREDTIDMIKVQVKLELAQAKADDLNVKAKSIEEKILKKIK